MALFSLVGLEGASKTTSTNTIMQVFREAGLPLSVFREPGGTPMAEALRTIHKGMWEEKISSDTEQLLMFAGRVQLYLNQVVPGIKQGHVLLDRCWWCTYAYQVHKRLDNRLFGHLVELIERMQPLDEVLFLDVDPAAGLLRARGRGELDRIEQQHLSFFENAREGYRTLAGRYPNATTIDANGPIEQVQAAVREWALAQVQKYRHETHGSTA
jgi:dTMP kinase